MADRDLLLVEFQQFTGTEDLGQSIQLLELHNWNLQEAVDSFFESLCSADSSVYWNDQTPSSQCHSDISSSHGCSLDQSCPADSCYAFDASESFAADVCSSQPASRLLHFIVNYRDMKFSIPINDNCSVGDIKEKMNMEIGVPVCNMTLWGWIHKNDSLIHDTDILRDLMLPKENTLILRTPCEEAANCCTGQIETCSERNSKTYELDICFKDLNANYVMKFPGSKTVRQVKEEMVTLTGPVRLQEWEGWPSLDDSVTLAESGIGYPTHQLTVKKMNRTSENSQSTLSQQSEEETDELDDDDEFEDADSCSVTDSEDVGNCLEPLCKPLIPDNSENELTATEHFCEEFEARYGERHPVFFLGSLDAAVTEALKCKAEDRKLLAIYLHHDHSVHANFFCSDVLCHESTVNLLSQHFITWAWDITKESNHFIFRSHCQQQFGDSTATAIEMLQLDQLPVVLITSRNRGSNEVVEIVHGNQTRNDLLQRLTERVVKFKQRLESDIAEERERECMDALLEEQKEAYEQSLEIDRAKKRKEEEERQKAEEERQKQIEQQQREKELASLREKLRSSLPDEPHADCGKPVITFRIRCPGDQTVVRRFETYNCLQDLLNYIIITGYDLSAHRVVTQYPRRDITQLDRQQQLSSLNFCHCGELLIVEPL